MVIREIGWFKESFS